MPRKLRRTDRKSALRFTAGLLGTFVLTLAVLGAVQYKLLGDRFESTLIEESAQDHKADTASLVAKYRSAEGDEDPVEELNELLRAIVARPGVSEATVIDRAGRVVASGDERMIGAREENSATMRAVFAGRAYAGAQSHHGEDWDGYEYIRAFDVGGRRLAFHVDQDHRELERNLSDLTNHSVLLVLFGLLVGTPLFYFVGGRPAAAMHHAALRRATKDPLTDLDNHSAFQDDLARAVARAPRSGAPLSLAMLDLDDFKFENDRRGHRHGDRLLKAFAGLLSDGRSGDRAFRVGGDEFALLLPGTDLSGARVVVERIRAGTEQLPGVGLSGGIAVLGEDCRDPEVLWEQADAALYEAKRRGGNTIVAADELEGLPKVATIEKVRAVRRLLADGRMGVAFQPIWDLRRDLIIGYEALARPVADYKPLAGPGEAFEVAEAIGHGQELDELCRRAILARASELPPDALLFINVAPETLDRKGLDGPSLVAAVEAAGLAPERVVLEISERTTTRLPQVASEVHRLRELGFRIALDDVGAGNAGLEMLRGLQLDFVKIDRSVVGGALEEEGARAVLAAIIAFALQTGAFIIAEGIETEQMLELVRDPRVYHPGDDFCVHGGQGYLLGRPAESVLDPVEPSSAAIGG